MIELSLTELRAGLRASLAVERWVDEVADAAPFASVADLLQVASAAATPLDANEIEEAIAEQPVVDWASQGFSRGGQSALGDDDSDRTGEIVAGTEAYEERFGRVFIIRRAGRTRADILQELERRLELPSSTELEIVGRQLREIALLRLEKLWGEDPADGIPEGLESPEPEHWTAQRPTIADEL